MKITLLAAAFAVCAPFGFAQSAPSPDGPPAVIQIVRESIKEGRESAHRKVEQDYANVLRKNKFPYHYLALSAESGPNEALFLQAFPSFAAIEEGGKMIQKSAAMKTDLDLVEARDGELRTESRTMIAVFRKDLSYMPAEMLPVGKFRYMMIDNYRVKLGQNEKFMDGAKVLLDGYKKSNMPLSILCYQVIAGAPNGVYLFVLPMDSLKQLDGMPAIDKALADALGAETLKQFTRGEGDVFQNMETSLYSVSPEMSYLPKEEEDAAPEFWRPKVTSLHAAPKDTVAKQTAPKP
jgi:hypothetical protein